MTATQTFTDQVFSMLEDRGQAALDAQGPTLAMRELMQGCFATLGDRTAHLKPGALLAGEHQYFVAGAFFVTPDRRYHMICGNVGFPPEQEQEQEQEQNTKENIIYARISQLSSQQSLNLQINYIKSNWRRL